MLFRFLRQARAIVMFGALFALTACPRTASKEEKALRADLRKAIDEQNYERAADLARRHLKLRPADNGTWDRLVRAQFGLHDLAAVKQTLDDWRRAVAKPSLSLNEYAGDLATAQKDDAAAIEAWKKVAVLDPKNVRVLEKIARLEKSRQFWRKEDSAWIAFLAGQDNA